MHSGDLKYYRLSMGWLLLIRNLNLDPKMLAQEAGLPNGLISRAQGKVTANQYFKLWNALEKLHKDNSLPIIVAKSTFKTALNVTVCTTLCSENMISAVARLNDYKSLISPVSYQTDLNNDTYSIALNSAVGSQKVPESLVITELIILVELIRHGTQKQIRPISVTTNFPVTDVNRLSDILGVQIDRGAENIIRFTKADAEQDFATANKLLWNHYEPLIKDKLQSIDKSTRYSSRVKSALYELLPSGRATLTAVADFLSIAPRTMQRRLKEEGYSFSDLLHTSRSELTMHYLKNTDMALYEVAFLLGFKDQNSFFRAFNQWTGTTPDAARSSLRGST